MPEDQCRWLHAVAHAARQAQHQWEHRALATPHRGPGTPTWAILVPSAGGGAPGMAVATTTLQLVGAAGR